MRHFLEFEKWGRLFLIKQCWCNDRALAYSVHQVLGSNSFPLSLVNVHVTGLSSAYVCLSICESTEILFAYSNHEVVAVIVCFNCYKQGHGELIAWVCGCFCNTLYTDFPTSIVMRDKKDNIMMQMEIEILVFWYVHTSILWVIFKLCGPNRLQFVQTFKILPISSNFINLLYDYLIIFQNILEPMEMGTLCNRQWGLTQQLTW